MQGVGNPHTAAKIVSGDAVLDLGSGLGVDALIAAAADVFLSIYSVLKNDELIILGTHVPHLYLSSCAQHFFEKATFTQI